MKSEKAKEYITHATCTAQEYAERFGGRELVVSRWDVSTAIELAEQDAEMRMREKAIKAYGNLFHLPRALIEHVLDIGRRLGIAETLRKCDLCPLLFGFLKYLDGGIIQCRQAGDSLHATGQISNASADLCFGKALRHLVQPLRHRLT